MRRPQPLWFGLLALAGAAVLNLDVDDARLSLEADDATDIDAYVASLSLPRLEGAGCGANDAPCVRKVVADALRAAVEDEAPPAPPRCEANATTSVRLAPRIAGLAARTARRCGAGPRRVAIAHARPSEARVAAAWAAAAEAVGVVALVAAPGGLGERGSDVWVEPTGSVAAAHALTASGFDVVVVASINVFLVDDPFRAFEGCAVGTARDGLVAFLRSGAPRAAAVAAAWSAFVEARCEPRAAFVEALGTTFCDASQDVASRAAMRASHGLARFGAFSAIELPGATEDRVLENARRLVPRRIQEEDVDEDRWVFYALDQGSDRWEADWLRRLFSEIRGGIEPGAPRATARLTLISALDRAQDVILMVNTHQQDVQHAFVNESARLWRAAGRKRVGLVVVDENHGDWLEANGELVNRLAFVLRLGFGAYRDPDAVPRLRRTQLVAPLGPTAFLKGAVDDDVTTRRYAWGFLGRAQSPARAHALASFLREGERRGDAALVHITAGLDATSVGNWRRGTAWDVPTNESSWRRGLESAVAPEKYRRALRSVVFAPSPPGNNHVECYRTYEALEAGAIPVVSSLYYKRWFDAPFPVVDGEWSAASVGRVLALRDDVAALRALSAEVRAWWARAKDEYKRRVAELVDGGVSEEPLLAPRCGANASLTFVASVNGVAHEVAFPVDGSAEALGAVADAFRVRAGLELGRGCELAADGARCVVDELVHDMRRRIAKECDLPEPPPPPKAVVVAAPPGCLGEQVAALFPVDVEVTHHPFVEATTPRLGAGTLVVAVTRDPVASYCSAPGPVPFARYAHRWLAHLQYWEARDDLTVAWLSVEDLHRRALMDALRARLRAVDDPAWAAFDQAFSVDRTCVRDFGDVDTLAPGLAAFGYDIGAAVALDAARRRLRATPIARLRDAAAVEALVLACGVNDENARELPAEMLRNAGGLRIYQYPRQFGAYVAFLAAGPLVTSYLEIGCRWGGTFVFTVEVLGRLGEASGGVGADGLRALAIDKWQDPALLREYAAARFRKLDSAGAPFAELLAKAPAWDLAFIDGDHSYDGVRRDFDLVRNRTTRYIVLHDIASDEPSCAGVRRFWREVRDQFETHEFVEQYDDVDGSYFGIGVIVVPRSSSL